MGVLSIDQIRVFVTIAEQGSFGKAARILGRHQSAVSYAIANLETQLGVPLFERTDRKTVLTAAGTALVSDARKAIFSTQAFKSRAQGFARGIEAQLTIAIDTFCPLDGLQEGFRDFAREFPMVKVITQVEYVMQAAKRVMAGRCPLGIVSQPMSTHEGLNQEPLDIRLRIGAYAAADHPLARHGDRVETHEIEHHLQLLLTDDSGLNEGMKMSTHTWHSNDLYALRMLLRAGVGWAFLPAHVLADDVACGRVVKVNLAVWPDNGLANLQMMLVWHADTVLGPAATWLIKRLSASPMTAA